MAQESVYSLNMFYRNVYLVCTYNFKMTKHNLDKSDFFGLFQESPTYREIWLTRTFVNSDQFPIPLEGTTSRDSTVVPSFHIFIQIEKQTKEKVTHFVDLVFFFFFLNKRCTPFSRQNLRFN